MAIAEFRYLTTNVYQPVYTVTNAVGNGSIITYTANNNFSVGQLVTISGVLPSQYNKTDAVITSVTGSSFVIASGSTGTFSRSGTATAPNTVISELPFTGVNFTSQLNSIGSFQGHVLLSGLNSSTLNVYDGTIPGKTILWVIYTNPTGGTAVVWSGVIWAREYDSASQTLSISAQEMLSLYNRRRISTTQNYSTSFTDPAVIAYNLLKYTEALSHGNTGLNYTSVGTSYSTKMIYNGYQLKSVYQAIKDLAQRFFDFRIQPYWNPVGGYLFNQFEIGVGSTYNASTSPVFQFPGNVLEYKFPEDGSSAVNTLYGLGYGANNTALRAIATDPALIGSSGTWPLLEDSASYTDIPDTQLLKDLTLGQLKATSYPPTTLEIVIPPYVDPYYPFNYSIGDEARVDIKDDFFPNGLSDIFRIMAISVNPGENGPSRVTITLTRQLSAGAVS
jgi:hypothetical protein